MTVAGGTLLVVVNQEDPSGWGRLLGAATTPPGTRGVGSSPLRHWTGLAELGSQWRSNNPCVPESRLQRVARRRSAVQRHLG